MNVQKTVFISYRRTNVFTARAVYQNLVSKGYDCFLDYENIDSGAFEQIILNQIAARAHFIVILTPSALERCSEPGDWLRREIEYAIDFKRNIVPLTFENFDFRDMKQYLAGKLIILSQYNALEVPARYFEEAMDRLHNHFLNKPLEMILHPSPLVDQTAISANQEETSQFPIVTEKQLSAEEWFERGLARDISDYDGQIADYSEAIQLNPSYAGAYNNRGVAHHDKGDFDSAISDYNEAIRINPQLADAYFNRGIARDSMGNLDYAIVDYSETIRLNSQDAGAYNRRGIIRYKKSDFDSAISDFSNSIELKNPELYYPYNNRGHAQLAIGDLDSAMADYSEAIQINPQYADAYRHRALVYEYKDDLASANADYQKYIDVGGQEVETVRLRISRNEAKLRKPAKRKRSR